MNTIFKIGLILLLTTGLAKAQEPDTNTNDLTLLQLVQEAGFLAWPLAALSIAAVFLIIFYTLTVRKGAVVSGRFMRSADSLIRKQDYIGLLKICNRQDQCISRITAKTVEFATKNPLASFEEVREVTGMQGQSSPQEVVSSREVGPTVQQVQDHQPLSPPPPLLTLHGPRPTCPSCPCHAPSWPSSSCP